MEEDILKVTRDLLKKIFSKMKTAISKKADISDVVLIENIGEEGMVAPLDMACRVPRENISENGVGILEVEKTVKGVVTAVSSTLYWDYVVWDSEKKQFLACLSGAYYANWSNRSDYEDDMGAIRQDRIFVFKEENRFYSWNGTALEEVCVPIGTTSGTAFSGLEGTQLKTTVASYEERIIRAALAGKRIITGTSTANVPTTYVYAYDILYISSGSQKGYYYYNAGSWTKITLKNLSPTPNFLKFPCQITSGNLAYTPFKDVNGMISSVYKGEVVGSYVKWYLIMKVDSEDQTYTAGTSSNASYYGQQYTCSSGKYNKPWELWLPLSTAKQSVYIDW